MLKKFGISVKLEQFVQLHIDEDQSLKICEKNNNQFFSKQNCRDLRIR